MAVLRVVEKIEEQLKAHEYQRKCVLCINRTGQAKTFFMLTKCLGKDVYQWANPFALNPSGNGAFGSIEGAINYMLSVGNRPKVGIESFVYIVDSAAELKALLNEAL